MRNFKAFTLAEILVVFVIIGIISTIGVTTVKPWEKAFKHAYSRIYNSLGLATYNWVVNGKTEASFPTSAQDLCKGLAYYMNNVEDNCSSAPYITAASPSTGTYPNSSIFKLGSAGSKPHLVLSNGVKLWIGASTSAPEGGTGNAPWKQEIVLQPAGGSGSAVKDEVTYYLVFADLNGDRAPNSPILRPNVMADVVAFAITNQFVVIPLGYPVVDKRYLSAHVMYPAGGEDNVDSDTIPTDPMTFYEAYTAAYGRYLKLQGDALSYQLEFNRAIYTDGSSVKDSPFVVKNCKRLGSGDCLGNGESSSSKRLHYYSAQPQFRGDLCGVSVTIGSSKSITDGIPWDYIEPICNIKIFDYH